MITIKIELIKAQTLDASGMVIGPSETEDHIIVYLMIYYVFYFDILL